HSEDSAREARIANRHASLDNTTSFWFTHASLGHLLGRTGFSTVYECFLPGVPGPHAPFHLRADGGHLRNARCTFVAIKGSRQTFHALSPMKGEADREGAFPSGLA